ncbi:hypothetical protein NL676_017743 [Syzygium grande]|nr:hypothetical protein NL676_017743 [Syzygium grande]
MSLQVGEVSALVFRSADHGKEVLKIKELDFAQRPGMRRDLERIHRKMDKILNDVIAGHKEKKESANGRDESGGSASTLATLKWATAEMLRNPRVLERAQSKMRRVFSGKLKVGEEDLWELQYLKLVIKETVREHPPYPFIIGESRDRCEVHRYELPQKLESSSGHEHSEAIQIIGQVLIVL